MCCSSSKRLLCSLTHLRSSVWNPLLSLHSLCSCTASYLPCKDPCTSEAPVPGLITAVIHHKRQGWAWKHVPSVLQSFPCSHSPPASHVYACKVKPLAFLIRDLDPFFFPPLVSICGGQEYQTDVEIPTPGVDTLHNPFPSSTVPIHEYEGCHCNDQVCKQVTWSSCKALLFVLA